MYYLNHSGIKGQRKGVRRFQYANKTYTPAGNDRYRPKKGFQKTAVKATVIATGAAWLGAINHATGVGTLISTMASTALSSIASNVIGVGSAVVSGLLTIPVPVAAFMIPVAVIATSATTNVGKSFVDDMLGDEYGSKKITKWKP